MIIIIDLPTCIKNTHQSINRSRNKLVLILRNKMYLSKNKIQNRHFFSVVPNYNKPISNAYFGICYVLGNSIPVQLADGNIKIKFQRQKKAK